MTKNQIVTELYNTGKLNGNYFGRKPKENSNPIKYHIKNLLIKNGITNSPDLIEDCYNEAFVALWKMNDDKFMQAYDVSPQKIVAILLNCVKWKCFGKRNTGNPRQSLIEGLKFASASFDVMEIDFHAMFCDIPEYQDYKTECFIDYSQHASVRLNVEPTSDFSVQESDNQTIFKKYYGFDTDYVYNKLTPSEQMRFNAIARSVRLKRKMPELNEVNQRKRELLFEKIKKIKKDFNC